MSRWYRAYEGTVSDPKLHEAAMIAGVSRSVVIAIWHAVLESCAALECSRPDITTRRLAIVLCESQETIEKVFLALEEIGLMIEGELPAWKKRQFSSDNSTERVRKFREKQAETPKEKQGNENETGEKRFGNAPETDTYTETYTNTDRGSAEGEKPEIATAHSSQSKTHPKKKFGKFSNVLLTLEEHEKLLAEKDGLEAIEFLSEYRAYKGYKAKSDYLAIRKWVFKALIESRARDPTNKGSQEAKDFVRQALEGIE